MSDSTIDFLNQQLDRYVIHEKIGTGGMARVYRGQDKNLQRTVAIKVLHEHLNDDPTFKQRFQREAHLVATFNHPNIVQVYDFKTIEQSDGEVSYMVMSYIPGDSLQDLLDRTMENDEVLSREEIRRVMEDLTAALDYAHMQGMVHRDIKPANILFDENKQVVLTDFGIARLAENSKLTQEGITVGTPAYMSPEQATGQEVDARSDIYALGIILYEMITGYPPFDDDGSISVLLKHVNEPPPSLSKHLQIEDHYLDAIISRALAKNPSDRYQSARQMMNDIALAFDQKEPTALSIDTSVEHRQVTDKAPQNTQERLAVRAVRSPFVLFAFGLVAFGFILLVGLLNDNTNTGQAAPLISEQQDEDTGISSMTGRLPVYFTSTFESDDMLRSYWPQNSDIQGIQQTIDDGIYQITNRRSGRAIAIIFNTEEQYEDFTLQFDARLTPESAASSGYGLVFRYVDEGNYNVFAIDGVGRYSIWILEDENWRELRENEATWTESAAVRPRGESNILRLTVEDEILTGYVNDEQIVMIEHGTFSEGGIGVYLAAPPVDDSFATVEVDSFSVMALDAGVGSMTGDLEDFSDLPDSMTLTDPLRTTREEATPEATSDVRDTD
jgi:serine/threonine protein kinase